MIDRIDVLVVAIIEWCGGNIKPSIYTKNSIEDCGEEIANCAIDSKAQVVEDKKLKECSIRGKKLLIRLAYPYAIIQDTSARTDHKMGE